jgi:uncharacterized Fe-S cluster-containing MiaB family protein
MPSFSYFPYQYRICHHVYNHGGCTFCGFHLMKRCVSPVPVSDQQMIRHFDAFVNDKKNLDNILKVGKILVETNGSWFVQIPKAVREHIYKFVEKNKIELHTQCRPTVINEDKILRELKIMTDIRWTTDGQKSIVELVNMGREIFKAIDTELKPYMLIFTGLEVANNKDLQIIRKGCDLEDFIAFSEFVRKRGAMVGANVLIGPPLVEYPVRKALQTAKFGIETMGAREVSFGCCIPRLGTIGHRLWRSGEWNPVSTTECSEIYRQTKNKYPDSDLSIYLARIHCFHGKYAEPRIRTEEQKTLARANVKKIAKEVFG